MTPYDAYGQLLARCTGLARRILPDADLAGQVAAEAITRVLEHRDVLDGDDDRITAWTLRVTRNLAIDAIRQRKRTTGLDEAVITGIDAESEIVLRIAVLDAMRIYPISNGASSRCAICSTAARLRSPRRWVSRPEPSRRTPTARSSICAPRLADPTQREDSRIVQITSTEQAVSLIGTDQTVSTRITGRRTGSSGFTADIGIPAIYQGRTGQLGWTRWDRTPDTIIGTAFDCVIIDLDAERRPIVTDALSADDAATFDRILSQIRALRPGDRRRGRVGTVLPFGAFVHFDGIRGLLHISAIPPDIHLERGQNIDVEIVETDIRLGRVSLRVADPV